MNINIIQTLDRYHFLNKRIKSNLVKNPEYAYYYAKFIIKGRWPEAEPYIMKDKDPYLIVWYARYIIKGRWPEA